MAPLASPHASTASARETKRVIDLPTYKRPTVGRRRPGAEISVREGHDDEMERIGIEPMTSWLQTTRSPS